MRIPRIYTGPDALNPGTEVELPGNAFRHTVQVLRLRPGAQLVLFNGDGHDYPAQLTNVERRRASAQVQERTPNGSESPLALHLVQAISKAEHMDITVQKAVELGVHAIQPVLSARGLRLPPERLARKLEHWRAVAVSACEQCGRSRIPELHEPLKLDAWLQSSPPADGLRLLLDPGATHGLDALPSPQAAVELLIGPEGGFAPDEMEQAARAGLIGLNLGPRVLRTETAGIVATAMLQAQWGDLRHWQRG
ncbi:MAG: 16S rRNA (uracil(1498)-N(3))-methyltransferase [Acidihalobacter sp.]|jgi:16S rRNA (uracil1498-N3)-methyltransferase